MIDVAQLFFIQKKNHPLGFAKREDWPKYTKANVNSSSPKKSAECKTSKQTVSSRVEHNLSGKSKTVKSTTYGGVWPGLKSPAFEFLS